MWLVLIFSMLVMLFLNAFMIDISYVVEERGMGTAKQAGVILSAGDEYLYDHSSSRVSGGDPPKAKELYSAVR